MQNLYGAKNNEETPLGVSEALGQSGAFLDFQAKISKVAVINRPVLLIGERGTGKELAALRLHYLSKRWDKSLITLNCAALNPQLVESELFGHERGAFTGAASLKKGRFESAHGGTLFLDEIGNIPMEAQEKILRAVEYGSFERVGSTKKINVNVRLVAATNVDLLKMSEEGTFKRDLLDRLSFDVLFLPPLRHRKDDIMLIANHFAARMSFELGRSEVSYFSENIIEVMKNYPWYGNVRELKNVVERAVYQTEGSMISHIDFNPFNYPFGRLDEAEREKDNPVIKDKEIAAPEEHPIQHYQNKAFTEAVYEFQVHLLKAAMEKARFNQKKAADELGLSYHQFRGLYRKFSNELKE
jgi:psp operon transcriptional activator